MASVKQHKTSPKRGIGLYSYEQDKDTTPFQYFAEIVVGTVLASLGIVLGYAQYQSPSRSRGELITSAALIAIGIFVAHPGAIFWFRRLREHKLSN
jgi:hypothetical protein